MTSDYRKLAEDAKELVKRAPYSDLELSETKYLELAEALLETLDENEKKLKRGRTLDGNAFEVTPEHIENLKLKSELAKLQQGMTAAYMVGHSKGAEEVARLKAALDRVMAEVKISTDRDFYEHLQKKIKAILEAK
jgi:hypothetical protein